MGRKILILVAGSALCGMPSHAQTALPLVPGTAPVLEAPAVPVPPVAPAAPAPALSEPAPTQSAMMEKLTLPAASILFVTTDKDLSTQDVALGDRFGVTVEKDVLLGDKIAIPAGTKGVGEITFVTKKGGFGRPGILGFSLKHLTIGDKTLALVGRYREEGGNNNGGAAATMFAVGILAIAVTGKQATIPAGRSLKARTGEDFVFEVATTPIASQEITNAETAVSATDPVASNLENTSSNKAEGDNI